MEQLERIKKNIKRAVDGFRDNVIRAEKFKKFIYKDTLSEKAKQVLDDQNKPKLMFNIAEAFISRLCGEFSKNEPDIIVGINDETKVTQQTEMQKELLEGHLRYVMHQAKKNGVEYDLFEECASGGYSASEVYYDYKNPRTFKQEIKIRKVYDSSMVAFDLLAREPSKKDARFIVELYPKSKDEIEEKYDIDLDDIKFTDSGTGFDWFYMQGDEKILILAKYVEIKKKRTKLFEIVYQENGQLVTKELTKDEYEEFVAKWEESGVIEAVPVPKQERYTVLESVEQYILIGNQVLEHEKRVGHCLPYVNFSTSKFFSVQGHTTEEMTRPYLYNIEGAQRLFDQLGISLAFESQNLSTQKMLFPYEGIVDVKYIENPQKYEILPYRSYDKNNPDKALPTPTYIQRVTFPQEIFMLFQYIPTLFQNILGSYDAQLGINNNQLSGAAIEKGAIQSNSSAMPLITKYLHSWTRIAEIVIDLIPKIMIDPQALPIIDKEGVMRNHPINKPYLDERTGQVRVDQMDYDPWTFTVKVEAGTSFSAQKHQAMTTLIQLSQSMPGFAQFMNTAGLKVLVDNLDIKGADLLKLMVDGYLQQQQQQAQRAQQTEQQNNPIMMKMQQNQQRLQLDTQKLHQEAVLRSEALANDKAKIVLEAQNKHIANVAQIHKADAENIRSHAEMVIHGHNSHRAHALEVDRHHHNKAIEHGELAHKVMETVLEHKRHEAGESKAEEKAEHSK